MTVRTTTGAQFTNLSRNETRPVFVLQLSFNEDEFLSCSGNIVFDGQSYVAGGADLKSWSEGREAVVELVATSQRVIDLDQGTWRNKSQFKLYNVPAVPGDDGIYTAEEGLLVLDGVIESAKMQKGRIIVKGVQKFLAGQFTPRVNFNELSIYSPAPGTVVNLDGEKYTLLGRR